MNTGFLIIVLGPVIFASTIALCVKLGSAELKKQQQQQNKT